MNHGQNGEQQRLALEVFMAEEAKKCRLRARETSRNFFLPLPCSYQEAVAEAGGDVSRLRMEVEGRLAHHYALFSRYARGGKFC